MVSISCVYFFSMYGHFERIEFLKEYVIKLFFLAVKPPCATTSAVRSTANDPRPKVSIANHDK